MTLGDMNMENIVGRPPQPNRRNRASSSGSQLLCIFWKGPAHLENTKRKIQLILWDGNSPNSYGTGPAHQRVEKHQLNWKRVLVVCWFCLCAANDDP